MSESISAVEARQKLGELLNRVALRKEEIIIERAGKKIARLLPIDNEKPLPRGRLDFRKAIADLKGTAFNRFTDNFLDFPTTVTNEPFIAGARFIGRYIPVAKQDAGDLESKRKRGCAALKIMDEHLATRPFMAAGSYTIADIALYAYTHVAGEAGLELGDYPAVGAWLQRVAGQPGHIPITHLCPSLDS